MEITVQMHPVPHAFLVRNSSKTNLQSQVDHGQNVHSRAPAARNDLDVLSTVYCFLNQIVYRLKCESDIYINRFLLCWPTASKMQNHISFEIVSHAQKVVNTCHTLRSVCYRK